MGGARVREAERCSSAGVGQLGQLSLVCRFLEMCGHSHALRFSRGLESLLKGVKGAANKAPPVVRPH